SVKLRRFVEKREFTVHGCSVHIPSSTVMWNAGVLGIAEQHRVLLPRILELTDEAYRVYQKHVMEQLAFSYYLQTHTTIISAESVLSHYCWNDDRTTLVPRIETFLRRYPTVSEAKEAYRQFPMIPITPVSTVLEKQQRSCLRDLWARFQPVP